MLLDFLRNKNYGFSGGWRKMKYTEDDKRMIAALWVICMYFRKEKYNLTKEAKDQIVDEFCKNEEFIRALEKCDSLISNTK